MIGAATRLLLLSLLVACNPKEPAPPVPPKPSAAEVKAKAGEAERTAALDDCKTNIAAKLVEYRRLMAARDYWPATIEIRRCADLLDDAKLKTLIADGEIKSYVKDIEDPKTGEYDRERAVDSLIRDHPAVGKKYAALQKRLAAAAAKRGAKHEAEAREYARLHMTDRQLRIGSSASEVMESGWGRPLKINSTTTARGTTEQWVYGAGEYLYFDNGILTAIQR